MRDMSRRDAVRLAAGLAIGAGAGASAEAGAEETAKPADPELERARTSPEAFMLAEQVTTVIDDTGPSRDLVVTSATAEGKGALVYVRSLSVRVFRADAGVDEFTRRGGVYWRFGDTQGRVRFKTPGALVMVVRDGPGTVRWYALAPDFRC